MKALPGVVAAFMALPSVSMANGTRPGTPGRPDPEVMLADVYQALSENRLREAQSEVDALIAAFPNFRLGYLIRGDLLLLHTQTIKGFGLSSNGPPDRINSLREEAIVRLKSLRDRPNPALVPSPVVQMRPDQKSVVLVDAKLSRLYVYQNNDGNLRLVDDYYVTQGRLGVDKVKEGDQKTPLGVYYITSRLPGAKLPDFYGPEAMPINYPNEWDRVNGRSGYGIWLHGTPSDSYSRPPLASDGCVVLTNPDIKQLSTEVQVDSTPVIISRDLKFITKAQWQAERVSANQMLEAWREDFASADPKRLRQHYSRNFRALHGQSLNSWLEKMHRSLLGARKVDVQLQDVSFFRYPDRKNLMVASFTQEATIGGYRYVTRKRQYWAKEGADWKIVSEAIL